MSAATSTFPSGFVTYVFTDIEDSTPITNALEALEGKGVYEEKLRDPQRERLYAEVKRRGGIEVSNAGDGHFFVFQRAGDALAAVVAFQQKLDREPIKYREFTVRVRIGLHQAEGWREPVVGPDGKTDYPGSDTNYAARVSSLGAGGQLLISESARSATGSVTGITYHEWPNRYLKGFKTPETVHEVLYLDGQRPIEPGRGLLPRFYSDPSSYVRRKEKEEAITNCFDPTDPCERIRLVTVKGPVGTGKSRIARECALRMFALFDGKIKVLVFSTPKKPAQVKRNITRAINVMVRETTLQQNKLISKYRIEQPKMLLVLENFETISSPHVRGFLIEKLTRMENLHVLATSCQPVGLPTLEKSVDLVDGMSKDEGFELLKAMLTLRDPVLSDSALAADVAIQVNRLLDVTECIPQNMLIAASWYPDRQLSEIVDCLERNPLGPKSEKRDETTFTGDPSAEKRHSSIRSALDYSCDLLERLRGDEAKRAFAACGLFVGSFEARAFAAIVGTNAEKLRIALNDASLLRSVRNGYSTRFRISRFARAYASEHLSKRKDAGKIYKGFVKYYLDLALQSAQHGSPKLHVDDVLNIQVAESLSSTLGGTS